MTASKSQVGAFLFHNAVKSALILISFNVVVAPLMWKTAFPLLSLEGKTLTIVQIARGFQRRADVR